MNLNTISLPCLVAKANNKSQNNQNLLHQEKSFFHVPLEILESAFVLRKLYNGCLEIIIWPKETNYLLKDWGYTSIDQVHKVWIESILIINIMFGEALWSWV